MLPLSKYQMIEGINDCVAQVLHKLYEFSLNTSWTLLQ